MDDYSEPPALPAKPSAVFGHLSVDFGLLQNAPNLVAHLPGLQKAAVGQGGIVRGWRREVPLLVGGVESVAMSKTSTQLVMIGRLDGKTCALLLLRTLQ